MDSYRASQQFRAQGQINGGNGGGGGGKTPKQQQPDPDAFMRLVHPFPSHYISTQHTNSSPARPRNRRLHQRHRRALLRQRPRKAEPATDPKSVRMVRGTAHECDAGDGGAGDARRGGGCLWWGVYGGCACGCEEFDGVLCLFEEVAC